MFNHIHPFSDFSAIAFSLRLLKSTRSPRGPLVQTQLRSGPNVTASCRSHSLAMEAALLFLRLWSLAQLLAVSWHWPGQKKFYAWFLRSELEEAQRRGLSTYGYKVFGCIPVPKLSLSQLEVVTYLYVALLLALALDLCPLEVLGLVGISGLFLSTLYHGSLWAERASSHHRGILSITLLLGWELKAGGASWKMVWFLIVGTRVNILTLEHFSKNPHVCMSKSKRSNSLKVILGPGYVSKKESSPKKAKSK